MVLALAWHLLAPPVRSVPLVTPELLVMDMRMLPVPQANAAPSASLLPNVKSDVENKVLLAKDSAVAVALAQPEQARSEQAGPDQPRQDRPKIRPKVRPDTPPKSVKPQPVHKQAIPPSNTAASEASVSPSASTSVASTAFGASASTGSTANGSTAAQDKNKALAVLVQAIESRKKYPKQARRTGAQGTVLLLVRVGSDGRVAGWAVEQASGQVLLDSATRQLGEKLVGLDTGVRGGEFSVLVPVRYALR